MVFFGLGDWKNIRLSSCRYQRFTQHNNDILYSSLYLLEFSFPLPPLIGVPWHPFSLWCAGRKDLLLGFMPVKKGSHNFFGFSCHILQLNLAINEFFLQSSLGIYFNFLRNLSLFLILRPALPAVGLVLVPSLGGQCLVPGAAGGWWQVPRPPGSGARAICHRAGGRKPLQPGGCQTAGGWGLGGFCLLWTENLGCFSLRAEFICGGYLL